MATFIDECRSLTQEGYSVCGVAFDNNRAIPYIGDVRLLPQAAAALTTGPAHDHPALRAWAKHLGLNGWSVFLLVRRSDGEERKLFVREDGSCGHAIRALVSQARHPVVH